MKVSSITAVSIFAIVASAIALPIPTDATKPAINPPISWHQAQEENAKNHGTKIMNGRSLVVAHLKRLNPFETKEAWHAINQYEEKEY